MKKIKIPKTTTEQPYIEFRFDKKGIMTLSATSSWYGGKNSGFVSSDGSSGNSCDSAKQLNSYIEAFKLQNIKSVEKEINVLQKKLEKLKTKKFETYLLET